jgi:glyoxylase I family protein
MMREIFTEYYMAAISGFHHVALRVRDFDKSVRFYTEVLGFTASKAWGAEPGRAIMLEVGSGGYLELFERPEEEITADTAGTAILHLAFKAHDTATLLEAVRKSGAQIQTETKDVDIPSNPVYPVRIAFFGGPDGEIVELFQER